MTTLCDECLIQSEDNLTGAQVLKRTRTIRCRYCKRRFRVEEYGHPRKKGSGRSGSRITEIKEP